MRHTLPDVPCCRWPCFLGASQGVHAQASLTLGDTTLAPGDSGAVSATITTDGSAVALQFDILYDPALVSLGTVNGGGALTANHSIASNLIAPGRDRVVITTTPVTALSGGALAAINLAIDGTAAPGSTSLTFAGVVISDTTAQPITPSSLTPGTITITGAAASPVEPEAIPATSAWARVLLVVLLAGLVRRRARGRLLASFLLVIGCLGPLAPAAYSQGIPGDANNDGRIDAEDVRLIVERILERGVLPGDGDCNRDAIINVLDTVCSQIPFVPGETAPIILGPGDRSIPAEQAFGMNLFAADPDPRSSLSWDLLAGPAGLTVAPDGVLAWTPGTGDLGENPVDVRVTDDTGRSDEARFAITVFTVAATAAEHAPPRLTVPPDQSLPVGTALSAQASATDPDTGDRVTFSLINGPAGMTIDPDTGALDWTPQPDQANTADVVIQAMDTAGASDFGSFQVTATPLNVGPSANDDVYIARRGETLVIAAPEGVLSNDSDPNGDALSATQLTGPTLGAVDSFGSDGGFSYTPSEPEGIEIGLDQKCQVDGSIFTTEAGTASAADVDNDGDVELAGLDISGGGAVVFVVDPTDCSAIANPIPGNAGQPRQHPLSTLVNLDDDPELEVVTPYWRGAEDLPAGQNNRLMAFNLDGSPLPAWPVNGLSERLPDDLVLVLNRENLNASPVAVDLNGDGDVALLAGYANVRVTEESEKVCRAVVANTTCNAVVAWDGRTGAILWEFVGGVTRTHGRSMTPTIVDLDMDGDVEIIWNQLVLDHEGNLLFELPVERTIQAKDRELYGNDILTVAIANFDNDPFPEIVGYDDINFYLFSHDGAIQWQRPYSGGGFAFPWADLTLAELDGDPFPEMVTMLTGDDDVSLTLRAFDSDGEPLWDLASVEGYEVAGFTESRSSSPVAFDLDGDGIDELIHIRAQSASAGIADAGLYVYNGATGETITFAAGRVSNLQDEPLTVADVDGDGSAEIVTSLVDGLDIGRLQIWDNLPGEPFPPARPIRSQTSVQPTWVNVDASLPTSIEPHWLQPGRNYWNRIVPDRDPLEPGQDSFTYRVSDGEFDSAEATVNIEIRPNGNPPFFLSEPKRGASAGTSYRYQPLVSDVDPGDSVTFELLNGPADMTLDAATGVIDWYPESNGDYPVALAATDSLGLSSAQIFTVTVGDPVTVPDLIGLSEADADSALSGAGLALGSRFLRSDPVVPAGEVLSQNPPAGAVAELGAGVRVTLSNGPTRADTDGDGDGFSPNEGDCDEGDDTIYPGAPEIDGDGIDQSCNGIDGDKTLVAIEVTPAGRRLLAGEPQPLRAMGIFEDGTAQDLTAIASWTRGPTFSSASAGDFTAEASFQAVSGSADFNVVERIDEDAEPLVRIDSPVDDDALTGPVEVRGVARDANFLRYELAVAPADGEDYVTIAESVAEAAGGPVGTFDATRFENDQYRLRLRAWDRGGNVSEDSVLVQVEGYRKIGNFNLFFEDLAVPVPGVPLRIVRSYRTDNKRGDDFGVGWRLGVESLRLTRNRPVGTAWRVVRSGLTFAMVEDDLHKVTVTLPDGRVESFDAVVSPAASPIVPFPALSQSVRYAARPGTYGTLEALGDNTVTILDPQPGPVTLTTGVTGSTYDPERYRYTAVNGTQVVIHREDGVESITDRNGNVLTIGDDGITHSAGRAVEFERDGLGRIVAIVDPAGNRQRYGYDANGDLVTHTTALGQVTRLEYDAGHNLLKIFDPAGRNILANRYDASGRIVSTTDSEGRELTFVRDPAANEERAIDADGAETLFEYDDRGNVTRKVDALGNETRYSYDANDNEVGETNPLGQTTTRTFDGDGNLLSVTNPLGNTTSFTVDAFGNVTSETDPAGNSTAFRYDAGGNLIEAVAPDGSVRAYAHGSTGEVVSVADETGAVQTFEYNARGDQTVRRDARGATTVAQFDAAGRLTGLTDRLGHATAVSVNALGSRTETIDPLGNREAYSYGLTGRLETVTDAAGNQQRQVTDGLGRVLSLTDGSGGELRFTFDLRGNLASRVDPRGGELRHEYDAAGRRTRTVHPDGSEERFAHDAAGRLVERTDRRGFVTRFEYDAAGRETAVVNALGDRIEFAYDANGNVVEEIDAAGNRTRHSYDELNRRKATELPDGRRFTYSYTARGELASETDPQGNTTTYAYDPNGNLLEVTEASGAQTRYRYDAEDNLIEQVDARGNVTRFVYDANNREIRRIYPDGSVEAIEYDDVGNVSARVRADGSRIAFEYDAEGRLVERSAPGGVAAYTVDAAGARLTASNPELATTYTRDSEGRVTRLALDDGRHIDYRYDAAGNIVERAVVALAEEAVRVTSHGYDALNRMVLTRDPDGNETSYRWTPTGEISTIAYPNGITTSFSYDTTRRATSIAMSDSSGVIERFDYSYDAADNIVAIEALDGSRIDYSYDAVRRLLRETHRNAGGVVTRDIEYAYDAVGNRVSVDDGGSVTAYSYDSADKLLSRGAEQRRYDPRGNLATRSFPDGEVSYRYDALDRLVAVDTPAASIRYGYDAEDRRVRRSVGASTIAYLVEPGTLNGSGVSQVLAETDPAVGSVLAENLYDFRLLARLASGERRYLHRDASENIRLLSDDSGTITDRYGYDAFGASIAAQGTSNNPYRFAGERVDPVAGLVHLRARDYEPLAGRFLGRDPFAGELEQPHSRHRYLYARNNPLSFLDPTGRFTVANLSATVSLAQIVTNIAPTVATGITTIILLNKFWKAGFDLRQAGYLIMIGDPGAQQLLPSPVSGPLDELGYAAFLAGNRLIEVGAFAIDAADKINKAAVAILGASKALVNGVGVLRSGGTSAETFKEVSGLLISLDGLGRKGKGVGDSLDKLAKAYEGESQGPDKETLKSRGQLEAERNKKVSGVFLKLAIDIFRAGL